jgi:hypothetical protein
MRQNKIVELLLIAALFTHMFYIHITKWHSQPLRIRVPEWHSQWLVGIEQQRMQLLLASNQFGST